MIDREKLMTTLQYRINEARNKGSKVTTIFISTLSDCMTLLKEQDGEIKTLEDKNAKLMLLVNEYLKKEREEAVEPKVEKAILDYQSWHYICGDCGGQIDINDNYCRHCGRVVAHLSNKI